MVWGWFERRLRVYLDLELRLLGIRLVFVEVEFSCVVGREVFV